MGRQPPKVKRTSQPRGYDATRRQQGAAQTREAIIDAAGVRFLRDGFAATTVASVAADVGVSADTIYKAFGGKAGLIRALRARALGGRGPVPAEQRSDALHDREPDGRAIIEAWGTLAAEVAPRVSPILLLIRDAATTSPEVRGLREEMDADRHRRMTDNARRLRDGGHLRPGTSLSEAADVLWAYSSPELYELLVLERGWSPRRYGHFIANAMIAALL